MARIVVSYGEFEVVKNDNDKGCKVIAADIPVYNLPNVHWWDKDGIVNALERDKEKIEAILDRKQSYFQNVA